MVCQPATADELLEAGISQLREAARQLATQRSWGRLTLEIDFREGESVEIGCTQKTTRVRHRKHRA